MLICIAMLLPTLGAGIALAATEQVVFSDDFSGYGIGETPAVAKDTATLWTEKAASSTATVTVENVDGGQVIRLSNSADKTAGPRLGKQLYLAGVDDLKVSFRVRTEGGSASFAVADTATTMLTIRDHYASWTDVRVEINVKNGSYVSYKNGQKDASGTFDRSLTTGIFLRFSASVSKGASTYFDDIKITTASAVPIDKLSDPANVTGTTAPVEAAGDTAAPAIPNAEAYQLAAKVEKFAPTGGTLIFAADFEQKKAGEDIAVKADSAPDWTEKAVSADATITVQSVDGSNVLCVSNAADASGGPRLAKKIYPVGLEKFAVSFMVRTEGSATVGFAAYNGSANAFSVSGTQTTWAAYEFIADLKNGTYISYKDGKLNKSGVLAAELDCEITIRFGGTMRSGGKTYYDNIRITTPDAVDLNALSASVAGELLTIEQVAELAEKRYTASMPQAIVIPTDSYKLFTYENNNGGTRLQKGTAATWTGIQSADTMKAVTVKDNEMIVAVNPRTSKTRSTLTKALNLGTNAKDATVGYSAYFVGDAGIKLGLTVSGNNVIAATPNVQSTDPKVVAGWNAVRYEFDFEQGKYTSYLNGAVMEKDIPFSTTAKSYATVTAAINMTTDTKDAMVMLDNVYMYTHTPIQYDTMVFGAEGVNWDMVKGEPITEKSFVSNLRPHPRLLLNSWDKMREKIANDSLCATWFANVKANADQLLDMPNITYEFGSGRNWLTGARNVRTRLVELAFVYGITGDRRYLDRAMEEMRNAGTHPDWSNSAPIIPSECMMGFAIAYDWMYDGLSDAQKAEIRKIICDKALWQFIHSYSGNSNVEIAKGTSNRTTVANSCGLMTAIALADEMPDVADYVYRNALIYAKPAVGAYNDDGGFPEGTMYWEYSTRFAVLLINALQAAPVDGYVYDADAQWYFDNQAMKNTAKYNIYLNSAKKKFNFGDSTDGLVFSPTLYWFADYCNEPFYKWYETDMTEKHQTEYQSLDAVQAIIWNNIDQKGASSAVDKDVLFNTEHAAVCTMRSSFADENSLFCAMQGGSNSTGHMHYSLGNFVVDALGQRFIQSVGASNYSSQFDSTMYYVRRTEGQNTLLVNPDASAGQPKTAVSIFKDYKTDEDEAYTVLDMTQTSPAFTDAKRGMYMTKGRKSVIIQDEFKLNAPSELYWFAQTTAAITLAADGKSALLKLGGKQMLVVLKQAPAGGVLSIMEAKPLPTSLLAADELLKTYYKLAVHLTDVTEGTISVEFIPIEDGETPSLARQTAFAPISAWTLSADHPEKTAKDAFANSVALKLGSPVAFANGSRTYVDPANLAVVAQERDGRTLVPVRFISEKIGGEVRWDEAEQKVTIERGGDTIILHIGQTEMLVNGEPRYLDVPAQTIYDRTMIPLRAMVEAVGKTVFWDDRGLILINGEQQNPTEDEIVKMLDVLQTLVYIGDKEFTAFDTYKTDYIVTPQAGSTTVSAQTGTEALAVTQTDAEASFTLRDKTYHFTFAPSAFDGLIATDDPSLVSVMSLNSIPIQTATVKAANYIRVANVEMSTGHDKYIPSGTIDNIINDEIINRWSGYGTGEFLLYDLGMPQTIHAFGFATLNGNTRLYKFKLEVSDDKENWTEVLNTTTSGTTKLFDIFPMGDVQARYVKLTGYGSTNGNLYNSWTEVRFWADEAQVEADKLVWQNGLSGGDTYAIGDTVQLIVQAMNASGVKKDSTGVRFSTDKDGIVSVTEDGVVTVIGTGTVKLTASFFNGFKTLTATMEMVCK